MVESTAKIAVRDLRKDFQSHIATVSVFERLSFDVLPGEFFCILGPSGCGKSTLLNILAGLLPLTDGQILIDGSVVGNGGKSVGYVFQEPRLLPWRTVLGNVRFGLEATEMPKAAIEATSHAQIERVGLTSFEQAYPHQLSGGMRHRVALARVLATNPDVLLMDEPFSALDFDTRRRLHHELLAMWTADKRTIIFVTHDPYEAVFLADRIMILSDRPATIQTLQEVDLDRPRRWRDPKTLAVYFAVLDALETTAPLR